MGCIKLFFVSDTSVSVIAKTALPFPTGIGIARGHISPKSSLNRFCVCRIVSIYKLEGLAFNMAAASTTGCGNVGLLPATAMTEAVWNFVWGLARGMILHSNRLHFCCSGSGLVIQRRCHYLRFTSPYYTTIFTVSRLALGQVRVGFLVCS